MQYTDNVSKNRTLETCHFINRCHSINLMQKLTIYWILHVVITISLEHKHDWFVFFQARGRTVCPFHKTKFTQWNVSVSCVVSSGWKFSREVLWLMHSVPVAMSTRKHTGHESSSGYTSLNENNVKQNSPAWDHMWCEPQTCVVLSHYDLELLHHDNLIWLIQDA